MDFVLLRLKTDGLRFGCWGKAMKKTLADFQPLKPAEQELLEYCQNGKKAIVRKERPTKKIKDNEIRAEFLHFLVLKKDDLIETNTIYCEGAWICGTFNLVSSVAELGVCCVNSVFEEDILLINATIPVLVLQGSLFQKKLLGDGLRCLGKLSLNGSSSNDIVSLIGAEIRDDFECAGSVFNHTSDENAALCCDSIKIGKSVWLSNNFTAYGKVSFTNAKIEGDLICTNGKFYSNNTESNIALCCDNLKIQNKVFLNDGFYAKGEVRFLSAEINGNLYLMEGYFENKTKIALNCEFMFVKKELFLIDSFGKKAIIHGQLNFLHANVNRFTYSNEFWRQKTLKKVILDGFTYIHISLMIDKQFSSDIFFSKALNFKSQPYKQLAKVLRDMGHDRDADEVMIALHDKKLETSKESWSYKVSQKLYRWISRYGYRPIRALKIILVSVWFIFGCVYWYGANVGVFAPSNPLVFQNKDYNCTINSNGTPWGASPKDYNVSNNWYKATPPEYTTFQPFLYSLDIILPVVDLKLEKDWGVVVSAPDDSLTDIIPFCFTTTNHFIRFLTWFESLTGWGLSLMLVAILSGLAKNEKE